MSYNRRDYVRIKAEYANKYLRARTRADERQRELHEKLPEVRRIDSILADTGRSLTEIILSGRDTENRIAALRARNTELIELRSNALAKAGYPADYSDVKYDCPKCSDSGYTDEGMCECMKRELVLAGYESSGLGGLIGRQSFDNFSLEYYREADRERMQRVVSGVRKFSENFCKEEYRNYLLFGGTGLGKTHLSTCIAKGVIDRGYDVMYVTSVGMLGDFEDKQFGSRDAERTERYYSSDLLIIDDLGTEMVNQFTVSYLYDVINSRINNKKCTIINTNFSPKELEAKYSERITSRLLGEYIPIPFVGTDIRMQKTMNKK